jgi:hypothetical protein
MAIPRVVVGFELRFLSKTIVTSNSYITGALVH